MPEFSWYFLVRALSNLFVSLKNDIASSLQALSLPVQEEGRCVIHSLLKAVYRVQLVQTIGLGAEAWPLN